MKSIARIISFICVACLTFGAIHIAVQLPADSTTYVEKKYAGWTGVLRCWVYSDWSCGGSFISWLNSCAAEFEKQHEGVYLEFETVTRQVLADSIEFRPDMLIFSEGIPETEATMIARGGYVFAENPEAAGTVIPPEYAAPMIAMYEQTKSTVPDSGIDLGLPASGTMETIEISSDAFRRFINGEIGRTIVSQAELAELIALRSSGRGPDWLCRAQGRYSWCDQKLMLLPLETENERGGLCAQFLEFLLQEKQQTKLRNIGAFAATGISVYDDFSAYREMEKQILAAQPLFPKSEHSQPDFVPLVRKLCAGQISAGEAAEILMQTCS